MYYELYIDVFFLENFLMGSILLFLINRILKCGQPAGRILAGAAAGSLLTCAAIALPIPGMVRMILYHTAAGSVMLAAGLNIRRKALFVKAFILLYVCAVFVGGLLVVFRPYMRCAGLFYAAAVSAAYIFRKLWNVLSCLQARSTHLLPVSLYTETGMLEITALLDTGNCLRDFVTGDPVSVLDEEVFMRLPGMPEMPDGMRLIPYQCTGGKSVMRVFRIRRMCIHMEEDKWIEHPLLGIGEEVLSGDGSFKMLLNPAVMNA